MASKQTVPCQGGCPSAANSTVFLPHVVHNVSVTVFAILAGCEPRLFVNICDCLLFVKVRRAAIETYIPCVVLFVIFADCFIILVPGQCSHYSTDIG